MFKDSWKYKNKILTQKGKCSYSKWLPKSDIKYSANGNYLEHSIKAITEVALLGHSFITDQCFKKGNKLCARIRARDREKYTKTFWLQNLSALKIIMWLMVICLNACCSNAIWQMPGVV